ncbi:hypothetical protein D3C83_256320 [compost metagenome]
MVRPTFLVDEKEVVDIAKQKALQSFGPELVMRLRSLRGSSMAVLPIAVSGPAKTAK